MPLSKPKARAITNAAVRRDAHDARMRDLIVEAWNEGASLRDLAAASGLSHAGIRNIVRAYRNS